MFRPITRRWGICFRSTQRYTVCALTPRYLAASRTVSGHSSRDSPAHSVPGTIFSSMTQFPLDFNALPSRSPELGYRCRDRLSYMKFHNAAINRVWRLGFEWFDSLPVRPFPTRLGFLLRLE